MHSDGELNLDAIERYADMLVASGVKGAFVCGSTGEFASLTVDERMRVAGRWIEASGDALKVIVHVGSTCLADARALASHAQETGADAVAAVPPYYIRPAGVDDLVEFCSGIASAAPGLPFYYYHIPSMAGVDIEVADFLAKGSGRIPNLAGAKFTHEDLMDFGRCVRLADGAFNMLFGRDEILLSALAHGARGAVGTTYNYAAPLYLRLMEAFDAGDMDGARSEQARAVEMIEILTKAGGPLSCGKAVMKMLGVDCGPPRPPLRSPSGEEAAALRAELERIGFFEYCMRGA
jgi:N-acetylneuraminate lyase